MNMSRAVHGAPLRADPAGVGRRRQQRRAVDWVAHCRTCRGDQWAVTIIDASEGGFGLSCTLPLPVDSRVNGTFKLTHVTADRHFETDPPDLAV
jgi:hypothetical protein